MPYKDKNKIKENIYKHRFDGNREKVLERDNWSCIKCGLTQEQHMAIFGLSLIIDHIDGKGRRHNNPNHDINNLQTLCCRCHGSKSRIENRRN